MNSMFYQKLALSNIKKNSKMYFPYILTCIGTIMMYYTLNSMIYNESLTKNSYTLVEILKLGSGAMTFFSAIFLFYTNSFLLKKRKKEFGLFNILGMEKKHINYIMFWETLYIFGISFFLGLLSGMLISKLIILVLYKIIRFEFMFGFEISIQAINNTSILFAIIFATIFLNTLRQIYISKPIELLKGGQVGEREPKTKWLITIIGFVCLGVGYYISVTTENPVKAFTMFFVAVILVMVGTYCLFVASSIAILKILKKQKNYYYKINNFVTVSGMLYRMKQNAVGLANICILSTAVIIMISSTVSLYLGMEDIIKTSFSRDIILETYNTELSSINDEKIQSIIELADNKVRSNNLEPLNAVNFHYVNFFTVENDGVFTIKNETTGLENDKNIYIVPLDDYNRIMQEYHTLNDGEILLFSSKSDYSKDTINILGYEFKVNEKIDKFINGVSPKEYSMYTTYLLVVKDSQVIKQITKSLNENNSDYIKPDRYLYEFDLNTDSSTKIKIFNEIKASISSDDSLAIHIKCAEDARSDFYTIYGGLLFLGIFLGTLFVMITVLIIYYKQVSEGYEDRDRFIIMQKVGMSQSEVKKTISSQIVTLFFLPIITATIHIAFAFPVVTKLLALLNLTNVNLFRLCTVFTILIFFLFYGIVYALTAKVYYKIVS